MDYPTFLRLISESQAEDWGYLELEYKRIFILKSDLNIRIEREEVEDDLAARYSAEWAHPHPNKDAIITLFNLYYGASLVQQRVLIQIDDARAYMPEPGSPDDLVITQAEYNFAAIINHHQRGQLDDYILQCKFRIEG